MMYDRSIFMEQVVDAWVILVDPVTTPGEVQAWYLWRLGLTVNEVFTGSVDARQLVPRL